MHCIGFLLKLSDFERKSDAVHRISIENPVENDLFSTGIRCTASVHRIPVENTRFSTKQTNMDIDKKKLINCTYVGNFRVYQPNYCL